MGQVRPEATQSYEHLTPELVPAYLAGVPALRDVVDAGRLTEVQEVGDGNLNLVFIVTDADGRGVVLKQALPYVRLVGPDWPMTPERARHEAEATITHGRLAGGLVPRVYNFDVERYIIAMEDLSDHEVWRSALNAGVRHEGAAADMGTYVARVAFGTSVFGMDPHAQKSALAAAVNPQLCEITEDLVFTEPYVDAGRNSVLAANEPDAKELADDTLMVAEMGWAKWQFMTQGEALVHGDLHTGSVMVRPAGGDRPRSTKAFDSEFAFYGPIGFDIGALWANYFIAAARAVALGEDDRAGWCLALLGQTWESFEAEFRRLWPRRRDPRVFTDRVLERFVAAVRMDSAGFAAAKAARRIVGLAKASDIESLPEEVRTGAARGVLRTARRIARIRHRDSRPAALAELAGEILTDTRTT